MKSSLISDLQLPDVSLDNLDVFIHRIDESDPELLTYFEQELSEDLRNIQKILHAWHREQSPEAISELVTRYHTIKGAANCIGQIRIGCLAAGLRDALDNSKIKNGTQLKPEITKASLLVSEAIKTLLHQAQSPLYSQVRAETVLTAASSIKALQQRIVSLE